MQDMYRLLLYVSSAWNSDGRVGNNCSMRLVSGVCSSSFFSRIVIIYNHIYN